LKNENVKDDLMSKKGKKEFQRVSHTLNWSVWEVSNFANRLGLRYEGLNPCKEITTFIVALKELTFIFGVK
jgi:hypothetical protein